MSELGLVMKDCELAAQCGCAHILIQSQVAQAGEPCCGQGGKGSCERVTCFYLMVSITVLSSATCDKGLWQPNPWIQRWAANWKDNTCFQEKNLDKKQSTEVAAIHLQLVGRLWKERLTLCGALENRELWLQAGRCGLQTEQPNMAAPCVFGDPPAKPDAVFHSRPAASLFGAQLVCY